MASGRRFRSARPAGGSYTIPRDLESPETPVHRSSGRFVRATQIAALIPIRDINPRIHFPYVTYLFMAGCAAAFVYQLSLGPALEGFIQTMGFVPARLTAALAGDEPLELVLVTLLSSAFLHGGWFHILGNLLYLRVFADNVEDRLGHALFVLFYLIAGAAGALAQWFFDPYSGVPMVGASGAIAGVLGAYIVMFPRARILTVFPVFIVLTFIEVPAFFFLGIWALQQFLNGFLALASTAPPTGGIAWFAHIGGFAVGLLGGMFGRVLHRFRRRRRAASGPRL